MKILIWWIIVPLLMWAAIIYGCSQAIACEYVPPVEVSIECGSCK